MGWRRAGYEVFKPSQNEVRIYQPKSTIGPDQWRRMVYMFRVRQEYDDTPGDQLDRITLEQVRSAMDVWLDSADLPPSSRRERFEKEIGKQKYYQRRNKQARKSHTKTRIQKLEALGIAVDQIKSCISAQAP